MGEVAKLGTLAERINAEHRACGLALGTALEHALEAGRLLAEVKASLPHSEFGPWLESNFSWSDRTARVYLRLHDHRDEIEAKRQSSATLSIDRALKMLRPPKPPPLWERDLPFDPQEAPGLDPDVERGLEEERGFYEAWKRQGQEAVAEQHAVERAEELRGIVITLDGLVRGYRPEEAGAALARMAGNGRAPEALREGIAWLERVLKEAETRPD